jgi:hypothetical protein
MMEAVRTSETSVDNNFTRQYIPEDSSEQVPVCFSEKSASTYKSEWRHDPEQHRYEQNLNSLFHTLYTKFYRKFWTTFSAEKISSTMRSLDAYYGNKT